MSVRSCYEILGVDPSADSKTIRQEYLRLSLKYHPDKNPTRAEEAKTMFLEIGRAYHTLGNEQRRAKYDATFKACLEKDDGTETPAKPYETYRDAFDEIVASLSEDAFATTLGVFLLTGGSKTAGRILGSLFGFFFTSEMTGRAFIRFHRETVARVVYKKECQHCVEQSLPMPEPPPPNKLLQSLHECMISFKEQVSRMMLGFGRRSAAKP